MTTLVAALLWVLLSPAQHFDGHASTFFPREATNNGALACARGTWTEDEHVCAHRTLPCGTLLVLRHRATGRLSWCAVLDRGPYGSRGPGGDLDLSPARGLEAGRHWTSVLDAGPAVAMDFGLGRHSAGAVRAWVVPAVERRGRSR